jgi:hypothetical protein
MQLVSVLPLQLSALHPLAAKHARETSHVRPGAAVSQ